ncbi:MAG: aldo/keto reductase [Burkholderiaceae bacterium]
MSTAARRLALGTVQFGLRYGVANEAGQVPRQEAALILQEAREAGVDTLDTAIGYGDSEAVIGAAGAGGWNIVTKLPPLPQDCSDVEAWVRGELAASFARLRVGAVQAVLLHRPADLAGPCGAALRAALAGLRQDGLARQTGISVYSPDELDALAHLGPHGVVQLPYNALDGRWRRSGWLARLHGQGTEIHARSAFLQGLLLMPAARRPAWFGRWQPLWEAWDAWIAGTGKSPLAACLGHALAAREIARVVVGVDSLAQWREILAAAAHAPQAAPEMLAASDPALLNPAAWKLT